MPTISIKKSLLDKYLGTSFSKEEYDELCFQYGLELDDIVVEKAEDGTDCEIYKIDIPANRYDLLCVEGLSRAWLVFQKKITAPQYSLSDVKKPLRIVVEPETSQIRRYVVGAVMRDITFDKDSYASFIDLQDRLHQNLGRKRTLASVGTHDLDTIKPPIRYCALPPEEIRFCPLNQTKELSALEQMKLYAESHLREYLPIIFGATRYPLIKDSMGTILSMPPIINSEHSKISLNTRNVFIEATGTDLKKLEIFLDVIVTMFSQYCGKQYTIEPIEVVYLDENKSYKYPTLAYRTLDVDVQNLSTQIGVNFERDSAIELLNRMCLQCKPGKEANSISITIPPTRHDILHACDIAEDLALAHGYNNIPLRMPEANTIAKPHPLNKLSDQLRHVLAQSSWTEILTFTLCSTDDISSKLRKSDQLSEVVKISNPKTQEFQVVRNCLLPGILKTIANNKDMPLPLKFFEIQDVLYADPNQETKCRNERHFGAIYYSKSGAFEIIHGLLDRFMISLGIPFSKTSPISYFIQELDDPTFFNGRCAEIIFSGRKVGIFGILHPEVLQNFALINPCSYIEMNIEPFL